MVDTEEREEIKLVREESERVRETGRGSRAEKALIRDRK